MAKTIEIGGIIQRPRREVFDFLADAENQTLWSTEGTRYTRITQGPIGVGTEFRFTGRLMGRSLNGRRTITAFNPPETIEFQSDEPFPFHGRYHLEEAGSATRVAFSASGEMTGLYRLLGPVFVPTTRRLFNRDFASLKALLEKRGAASTP